MNKQEKLHRNGTKVDTLYRAVRNSEALELIPTLVKQILSEEMWREHIFEKTGQEYQFDSLIEFIEKHPPDGLGTEVEKLFSLCREDSSVLEMLDQAIQDDIDNRANNDVDTPERKKHLRSNNAQQSALRKLRQYAEQNQEAAIARQAVLEGRMSANAALVELGLRKKRISIPKEIDAATEALKKHYSSQELEQIIKLLQSSTSR